MRDARLLPMRALTFLSKALVGRIFLSVLAVLGALRLGVGVTAWRAANNLERPSYTVLQKLTGGVEIREYESYLIAETTVAGTAPGSGRTSATGSGFRTVAGYIFGKNKPKAKMAMTAPVRTTTKTGGEKMAMTAPVRTTTSRACRRTELSGGWRAGDVRSGGRDVIALRSPKVLVCKRGCINLGG